jgi:CHAT domain-containing protein
VGTNLRDYRVVAFATHGLKAGDLPDLSQPALALSATAAAGESPLLTLDDVLRLQLAADWVVLSACNTAASDGASEEAISGLARGFFFAGARSLLVTHWSVETASAQALVTAIFEQFAKRSGTTRAESLRQAQLELISGKASAQYRHPFFWAPYALVGDGSK